VVEGFTRRVKEILREHGWEFARPGKGDHEIWTSPQASRPIVVDGKIMSRHTANAILKRAGISRKL
jgi:predicted RNA binding protein YcfA (HicA-like mRNA interferase family)